MWILPVWCKSRVVARTLIGGWECTFRYSRFPPYISFQIGKFVFDLKRNRISEYTNKSSYCSMSKLLMELQQVCWLHQVALRLGKVEICMNLPVKMYQACWPLTAKDRTMYQLNVHVNCCKLYKNVVSWACYGLFYWGIDIFLVKGKQ